MANSERERTLNKNFSDRVATEMQFISGKVSEEGLVLEKGEIAALASVGSINDMILEYKYSTGFEPYLNAAVGNYPHPNKVELDLLDRKGQIISERNNRWQSGLEKVKNAGVVLVGR